MLTSSIPALKTVLAKSCKMVPVMLMGYVVNKKTYSAFEYLVAIGVTAGASAPDVLIEGVIQRLRHLGAAGVSELDGEPENMVFALPKELRLQLVG